MYKYFVTKVDRRGGIDNIFKMLETCYGALPTAAVIAAADVEDKIRQPKLTYALSLTLPEKGCDVAIVGECSTRGMQAPKQIWIFNESENNLVTHEDVQTVIRILKQDYARNPLTLYFE